MIAGLQNARNLKGLFYSTPSMAQQPLVGQSLPITEASQSHSETPHSEGVL